MKSNDNPEVIKNTELEECYCTVGVHLKKKG